MSIQVEILDDWAMTVDTRWAEMLRPGLRMCLPTGSTPRPVYRRMTAGFAQTTVLVLDGHASISTRGAGRGKATRAPPTTLRS